MRQSFGGIAENAFHLGAGEGEFVAAVRAALPDNPIDGMDQGAEFFPGFVQLFFTVFLENFFLHPDVFHHLVEFLRELAYFILALAGINPNGVVLIAADSFGRGGQGLNRIRDAASQNFIQEKGESDGDHHLGQHEQSIKFEQLVECVFVV